jgi:putative aminopeptidase FrvX
MGQRDLDSTGSLLQELLWTYGPCGQEDAVRTVCARELQTLVDDMWTDDAGNLIGYIGADDDANTSESRDHRHRTSSIAGGSATRVMAHMDELSMLVKRVEADGTLHMTQLGVMYPGNFGLRPGRSARRPADADRGAYPRL